MVLTGHSLGGGIGKIVSAKLGIPIVAISAPGIYLSHKIFDVPRANIDKYEINLMAPEDIVPKVRLVGGETKEKGVGVVNRSVRDRRDTEEESDCYMTVIQ